MDKKWKIILIAVAMISIICAGVLINVFSTMGLEKYKLTFCSTFDSPASCEVITDYIDGGTVETYYGTYINTSLGKDFDYKMTGDYHSVSKSMEIKNSLNYYDEENFTILITYTLSVYANVEGYSRSSNSYRYEYGNHAGDYPTLDEKIDNGVGYQWSNGYEMRSYVNGRYDCTDIYEDTYTVSGFVTKNGVSTIQVDRVGFENGQLYYKDTSYYDVDDGTLIYGESYDYDYGRWELSYTLELISKFQDN